MNVTIAHSSMIRGADGRLYAVTAQGVAEIPEAGALSARAALRAGDRIAFDTADHEAGRVMVTPGF